MLRETGCDTPEYVEAMWLMLQQPDPDDYVIAPGKIHSIREFAEEALLIIGIDIDWVGKGVDEKGIDRATGDTVVRINPDFFRPTEVDYTVGGSSKVKEKLGWTPKTKFSDLVRIMVEHDLKVTGTEKR
jgi:GDPmannose 4,6-dehydratase